MSPGVIRVRRARSREARPVQMPRQARQQSESRLQAQVLAYLRHAGIPAWRANAGGGLRHGRPVRGNPAGTADVLGCLPPSGRLLALELKSLRGRLRPAQRDWLETMRRAGALALVVRDLDELRAALRLAGLNVP